MNIIFLTVSNLKALMPYNFNLYAQNVDAGSADSFIFLDLITFLVLGLSVILNIVLLFSLKMKKRGREYNSEKSGVNYEDWYYKEKIKNGQLDNENKNLKSKIYSLQNKEVQDYKANKDVSVESRTQLATSNPATEQHFEDEKPKTFDLKIAQPNIIYLPSPFENNRFSLEDVSTEQTASSLYQIILDASNTTGKLLILENADFTRALNSPDLYLEKACIYQNAFNPNASEIQVVEKGSAKLENQDWVITEKIKIKFV